MPRDTYDLTPMRERADFVGIVGAPRCGTTSLAGFLQDHPGVCFSSVKEPHFFSRVDLGQVSDAALGPAVDDHYLARYFAHRGEGRLLAEGSVTYLYAPERMAPILRRWPNARFVIALRDPLAMLPSLHQRLLCTGDETVADFEAAWRLRCDRMHGLSIPPSCIDPRLLQYEQAARLGAHVEAFFRAVGPERCFVALFDDLAARPAALYDELLGFLGLPAHSRDDFAPRRASRGVRSAWLQRLLKRPPVATRMVLAGEKYRQRIRKLDRPTRPPPWLRGVQAVRKAVLRWNQAPAPASELPDDLRAEICRTLAPDIQRLSILIDRDLGHWLDGAAQPPAAEPRAAALVEAS